MSAFPEPAPPLLYAGAPYRAAELQAMAADGLLHRVFGHAYLPHDVAETMEARALAVRLAVPPAHRERTVIGWSAAAWIYGCAPEPAVVDLLADRTHRAGALRPFTGCRLHEVSLAPGEIVYPAGTAVTSALRTALDIALHAPEDGAAAVLARLSAHPGLGCPPGRIRAALEHTARRPGKHRALARLEAMTRLEAMLRSI